MVDPDAEDVGLRNETQLRILVTDDEPDVRLGLEMLLSKRCGAEVRSAADGLAALEVLSQWQPHLVITDVTMERMDGISLLKEIKQRYAWLGVIMITGFGTIELAVDSFRLGAAHFITKPFDNDEIVDAVMRIGQEACLRERVQQHRTGLPSDDTPRIVAQSRQMREVMQLVRNVAPTPMAALIEGESGTGKELIARSIHHYSLQPQQPFLAMNTAAVPDTLLEAELFGHTKGAFTGATSDRRGIFEQARGGTVFLDEINLMSPAFQAKLLRVLQEKQVVPLGRSTAIPVDFRLVTASSIPLNEAVAAGTFREDLYYRLQVVVIDLPPLRVRREDIPLLAAHFVEEFARLLPHFYPTPPRLTSSALEALMQHDWPGNIRELENSIQRALVLAQGGEIGPDQLSLAGGSVADESLSYEEGKQEAIHRFQKQFVQRALAHAGGNVTRAAELCGLTRAALQRIMRSLKIDRNDFVAISPG